MPDSGASFSCRCTTLMSLTAFEPRQTGAGIWRRIYGADFGSWVMKRVSGALVECEWTTRDHSISVLTVNMKVLVKPFDMSVSYLFDHDDCHSMPVVTWRYIFWSLKVLEKCLNFKALKEKKLIDIVLYAGMDSFIVYYDENDLQLRWHVRCEKHVICFIMNLWGPCAHPVLISFQFPVTTYLLDLVLFDFPLPGSGIHYPSTSVNLTRFLLLDVI